MNIPLGQRLSFRNVIAGKADRTGSLVWALVRGHWRAGAVVAVGKTKCCIELDETAARRTITLPYDKLAGRCRHKNGADKPEELE